MTYDPSQLTSSQTELGGCCGEGSAHNDTAFSGIEPLPSAECLDERGDQPAPTTPPTGVEGRPEPMDTVDDNEGYDEDDDMPLSCYTDTTGHDRTINNEDMDAMDDKDNTTTTTINDNTINNEDMDATDDKDNTTTTAHDNTINNEDMNATNDKDKTATTTNTTLDDTTLETADASGSNTDVKDESRCAGSPDKSRDYSLDQSAASKNELCEESIDESFLHG